MAKKRPPTDITAEKRPLTDITQGRLPIWLAILGVGIIAVVALALRGGSMTAKGTSLAEEVRIEFPAPGTTLIKVNGQPDKASYLLAASDLWANTGLVLKPGQGVSVTASGRANLAVHRLIDAAVQDVRPRQGWMGPGGGGASAPEVKDTYRRDLKIAPKSQDGVLLACLHKQGEDLPGKDNPKPSNLIVVGDSGVVVNSFSEPRTIWFVINDAVLDDSDVSRRAYLEIEKDNDQKVDARPDGFREHDPKNPQSWSPKERWKNIVELQYWNLWYDDNMGFYQIQFDFHVPTKDATVHRPS